jgi:hypothetical protein
MQLLEERMLRSIRVMMAVGLVLAACSSESGSSGSTVVGSTSTGASSSASAVPPVLAIPACTGYLTKMKACIEKAPEAERAPRAKSLADIETTWNEQNKTAEGRARLQTACAAALTELEKSGGCQ